MTTAAGPEHLVVVDASEMVGGYALDCAHEDPAVGNDTAIGRRTLGLSHPKLKEILDPRDD